MNMVVVKDGIVDGKRVSVPDGKYYSTEEWCIVYGTTDAQVRQWKSRGVLQGVKIFGRNFFAENAEPIHKKRGRPVKNGL